MTRMNLQTKLNPKTTALLVIDIQNDFCSPSGLLASMGKDVLGMDIMIEKIKELANVCEDAGIPTFYTQQIYDRSKLTDLQKEQYDLDGRMVTCDINGKGYKFHKLNPPADRVFPKYTYNVFSNPDLSSELSKRDIKTLIITGVSTQICVETAIRNGFDLGYKIVVPRNLVATTSKDPNTQERTLRLVEKTYGVVVDSAEVIALIQARKTLLSATDTKLGAK
jgi:ureidoacrylate peracid hydrolase